MIERGGAALVLAQPPLVPQCKQANGSPVHSGPAPGLDRYSPGAAPATVFLYLPGAAPVHLADSGLRAYGSHPGTGNDTRGASRMALREFTDEGGCQWCAWDTHPISAQIRPEFAGGWLTFESAGRKLRLAPVPHGWDAYPVERLRMMLRAADGDGTGREPE